jgi:hypothetical protein
VSELTHGKILLEDYLIPMGISQNALPSTRSNLHRFLERIAFKHDANLAFNRTDLGAMPICQNVNKP